MVQNQSQQLLSILYVSERGLDAERFHLDSVYARDKERERERERGIIYI